MNRRFITVLIALLFFSSVFGMISYIPSHTAPDSTGHVVSDLSPLGVTGGTSISVAYWTNGAVSNSGTTTVNLPVNENSSANGYSYSAGAVGQSTPWSFSSGTATLDITTSSFYFYSGSTITFNVVFPAMVDSSGNYVAGTLGATLGTSTGTVVGTFSHDYDYAGTSDAYVEASMSFGITFYFAGSLTLDMTLTSPSIDTANSLQEGSTHTLSSASTQMVSSEPSEGATPFAVGWTYGSATSSFIIPQYESSYDLVTENSANSPLTVAYNSNSQTVPYTFTGSLTQNSITFTPQSDPPSGATGEAAPSWSVQYYLGSQYQVSSASVTQTASPSYNYTQVSGTTNEASASFDFSGSTPSTAVFIPYESGTSSLATDSTSITFTPTITVQNPYYTYTQNQLVASLSGSSSGSSTTSNSASPSFTGDAVSSTSSLSAELLHQQRYSSLMNLEHQAWPQIAPA